MIVTVFPSSVAGTIASTPSKSHAQRAIAIAALTKGASVLSGIGSGEDVKAALGIADAMGAEITLREHEVEIDGGRNWTKQVWECGESGLALRMFAAIAALGDTEITLTAHGSLRGRPVSFVEESLKSAGIAVSSRDGRPPLAVKGPFGVESISTDASSSSQFLTGLLIALPMMSKRTTISVPALVCIPYIDHTIETIAQFGPQIRHDNYTNFYCTNGLYSPTRVEIQGDWSGMAFMPAAGAINGEVTITGLQIPSTQADSEIVGILSQCGVSVNISHEKISVKRSAAPEPLNVDATQRPDLIPVLVALAVHSSGISTIRGANRLRVKESDRALALETEFRKLGVNIKVDGDVINIGGGPLKGGDVDAHGDHRIAMSLACAAINASGPVMISGADAVRKSYPGFFDDLTRLGVKVQFD
jgi:3-phosphoshikimate 1-carboxyvinyltransferase